MAWYEILIGVLLLLSALVIIAIILLQEGRRQGIAGAVSGGADTFLSKSKAHSLSAKLRRITKYIAIIFILAVIAANAVSILAMN
ncbi:MAG: preprotein translocase subunit SecG [Clostridia bacterium]|nr:preprotein translocase subunit SecG [Clostridia bacterium]